MDTQFPQFVSLIGIFTALVWFPTLGIIAAYAFRRLTSRERLKAIEHGLDLASDPQAAADGARRAAVVLMSLGVGIAIANGIVALVAHDARALVFLGLAVIPFAVGVGLFVDYRITKRATT